MTDARYHRALPAALGLVAALVAAPAAFAQGSLSTQGLGFPPGQLSTASKSMGGANGEIDPLSALNPAALGLLSTAIVLMQAEPEYRELRVGTRMQRTSVARFPLFLGAMPVGQRWTIGVSASTLLDRTWETTTRDSQIVTVDTIRETRSQRSDGSIDDLRIAVAFSPASWIKIGVAGHAYSGRDFLRTLRVFDNTNSFLPDTQQSTVSFGGNAVSIGAQTYWPRRAAIGVSYRKGGPLKAYVGDVVTGDARVPDRVGVSAVYLGIAGTALAVRASKDSWSSLVGLSRSLNVHEGWDLGAGADVSGPRLGGSTIFLRAGGRWRTLPFSVDATPVKERSWSGGFGLPMANNRVELSIGAIRATRTGGSSTSENSWTLSTGFAVRP